MGLGTVALEAGAMAGSRFQSLNLPDQDLNRVQSNIANAFNSLTSPFIDGILLTQVSVAASPTSIPHKLGRQPQIWVICDQDTTTTIKRTAWDSNTITLQAGAPCIVSVWVN